jgi:hypothetical protein
VAASTGVLVEPDAVAENSETGCGGLLDASRLLMRMRKHSLQPLELPGMGYRAGIPSAETFGEHLARYRGAGLGGHEQVGEQRGCVLHHNLAGPKQPGVASDLCHPDASSEVVVAVLRRQEHQRDVTLKLWALP